MAQYSHLTIYNTAFSLLREFYNRIPKFDKQYKHLIGKEIIRENIEIIKLIIEINNEKEIKERKLLMKKLILCSESLIISLRISNELKQLGGEKQYLFLLEKAVSLSKQVEGWRKSE